MRICGLDLRVCDARAGGGICLESIEWNLFFARFADTVRALFHLFKRIHDVLVAFLKLFDERHVGGEFFYQKRAPESRKTSSECAAAR